MSEEETQAGNSQAAETSQTESAYLARQYPALVDLNEHLVPGFLSAPESCSGRFSINSRSVATRWVFGLPNRAPSTSLLR